MRIVPEIVRKGIASYRVHGFRGFVEAALTFLLIKFRLFLSLRFNAIDWRREERMIFYIDYFAPQNSNFYWLKAFQKFGRVKIFDIIKEDRKMLREKIMNFKPVHIHLGGTVKDNMVPPQLLSDIKKELNCTISVFYGDGWYSPYHCQLAKVVDYIYVSDKTQIKINEKKGYHNFKYMPCPTDPKIFNYKKCEKCYDLVFIGNNNQPERLPLLKSLAGSFNLKVFGNGWEKIGLNYGKPVYGAKFSQACNRAKICLVIVEPRRTNLEAYFSNRLVNTLATRSFCIQTYTPGLEKVFTNRKHLVWYTNENALIERIKYYLVNDKEREEIAAEGQKEVHENYTYEKSVKRILYEASDLDKDWQENLTNEEKGKVRFSVEWYKKHPITRELLDSDIWRGAVVDLGCGIGTRAFLAAQKNNKVEITGVDGSQYAIKYALNNFKLTNLDFLCGDLLKLPFQDHAFDNAYILAVIEHIAETDALLGEIKRVVKPKGRLFLSVTEKDYHSDPSHVHIFTKGKLKNVITHCGLKVLNLYVKEHIIFCIIEI